MTHRNDSPGTAYRRMIREDLFGPEDVRRAKRLPVRLATARGETDDWLSLFETELADALDDFEALREDGRETQQLAGYIGYLADCVAKLRADPRGARASLDRASSLR
jgi:hypothetical protein